MFNLETLNALPVLMFVKDTDDGCLSINRYKILIHTFYQVNKYYYNIYTDSKILLDIYLTWLSLKYEASIYHFILLHIRKITYFIISFRVNYSICAYIVRFMLFFIHMILLYECTHVTVCVTNDWLKQSLPTPAMHDDFYHKPYWQSPKDCGVPSLKILKYVTKS